jgi:hypothetical protein
VQPLVELVAEEDSYLLLWAVHNGADPGLYSKTDWDAFAKIMPGRSGWECFRRWQTLRNTSRDSYSEGQPVACVLWQCSPAPTDPQLRQQRRQQRRQREQRLWDMWLRGEFLPDRGAGAPEAALEHASNTGQ